MHGQDGDGADGAGGAGAAGGGGGPAGVLRGAAGHGPVRGYGASHGR